ncbi:hypothetical protein [Algoriphagus sediminis]|uniref:MarR family transcriptional regulator n=1 Tax=Algoriphagus sediminis TaxID=3057113 RepID=A0ABT7YA03_9BACT|nr:hypothetical protein [Algoriphagus sediminis]MDN3203039.1 hypothetical protein [Algoriphagus sediminis]
MNDDQFDLIDELYFVQDFDYLRETLGWADDHLIGVLQSLVDEGWVKVLKSPDEELFDKIDLKINGTTFMYLATKEGLMKHNMG